MAGMTGDLVGRGEAERLVVLAMLRDIACLPIPEPKVEVEVPFTVFATGACAPPPVRVAGREMGVDAGASDRLVIAYGDQYASDQACARAEEVHTF